MLVVPFPLQRRWSLLKTNTSNEMEAPSLYFQLIERNPAPVLSY